VPDTSPDGAAPQDGLERAAAEGGADARGSLDVPEWVSELRRLYVEPKTRASLRREGAIVPQKRKLGLPGGRGSRRGTTPAEAAAPGAQDGQPVDATVVAASLPSVAIQPTAPLEPTEATPVLEESGEPYTPPDANEEEKVATWLNSYLVATGHAADDGTEDATTNTAAVPSHHRQPRPPAASAEPVEVAHPGQGADSAEPSADVLVDEVRAPAPGDAQGPGPEVLDEDPRDAESVESHPRSLAELAGLTEPEPALSPTSQPHREPDELPRVVPEAVAAVVPEVEHAVTPEVESGRDAVAHGLPAVALVASSVTVDAGSPNDVAPERVTTPRPPADDPLVKPAAETLVEPVDAPVDETPAEAAPVPERRSTVPPVTLSWREAESFEIGVPGVEDSEDSIVVEAPSQLVAESRRRRRELHTEEGPAPEPEPSLPAAEPAPEKSHTRAAVRAASGGQPGVRRRALLVGLVLVVLAIGAWYFLLREDGGESAARTGEPGTVLAVSLVGSVHAQGTPRA